MSCRTTEGIRIDQRDHVGLGEGRGILVMHVNFRGAQTRAGEGPRAFRPTVAEMPHKRRAAHVGAGAFRQVLGAAHAGRATVGVWKAPWRAPRHRCRSASRQFCRRSKASRAAMVTALPTRKISASMSDLAGERRSDKSGLQAAQRALRRHQTAHCFIAEGRDHAAESCAALRPILADDGSPAAIPRLHRRQRLRKQHALDVTGRLLAA